MGMTPEHGESRSLPRFRRLRLVNRNLNTEAYPRQAPAFRPGWLTLLARILPSPVTHKTCILIRVSDTCLLYCCSAALKNPDPHM